MKKLEIYSEVKGFRVPRARLVRSFEKFLKLEKPRDFMNVNLVFVGEKKISELNEKWRKRKGTTDVLSFNYENGVGEIYICVKVAKKYSDNVGISLQSEILSLFVHGLLHLAGHTHANERDFAEMMDRAGEILE